MRLFVYLEKEEYISTWENGGELPLKLVTHYLADERAAEKTPDEGRYRIVSTNKSEREFVHAHKNAIRIGDSDNILNSRFSGVIEGNIIWENGRLLEDGSSSLRQELSNGIVLCFSKAQNKKIAKLFKRKYCVEIVHFHRLKASLDQQLGSAGISGSCKYTTGMNRNHFLKSVHDKWQAEFRVFWEGLSDCVVELPHGIARRIKI